MNVVNEFDKAIVNVNRLKTFYPKHDVLIVFDNSINNLNKEQLTKLKNCYLFNSIFGYRHSTHSYLKVCLNSFNSNYIIKLDPDTWVNKFFDFSNLSKDYIHCLVNHKRRYTYGGLIIYPNKIAKKIYNSSLLKDEKYSHEKFTYKNKKHNKVISCQDKILYDVCEQLNIKINDVSNYFDIRLHPIKDFQDKFYFHHKWL